MCWSLHKSLRATRPSWPKPDALHTWALAHVAKTAFCNSATSTRFSLGCFWNPNNSRGDLWESAQRSRSHQDIIAKAKCTVYMGPDQCSPNCILQFGEIQQIFPGMLLEPRQHQGRSYGNLPKGLRAISPSWPKPNVLYTWALTDVIQTAFCNSATSSRSPLGCLWNYLRKIAVREPWGIEGNTDRTNEYSFISKSEPYKLDACLMKNA